MDLLVKLLVLAIEYLNYLGIPNLIIAYVILLVILSIDHFIKFKNQLVYLKRREHGDWLPRQSHPY